MIQLAKAYVERGGKVILASEIFNEAEEELIEKAGVSRLLIDGEVVKEPFSQLKYLCECGAEWLVLFGDHYGESYRKELSKKGAKLLLISDAITTDPLYCEAILNELIAHENWERSTKNPLARFLGPEYSLKSGDEKGAKRIAAALDGRLDIVIATARNGWLASSVGGFAESLSNRGHAVRVVHEVNEIVPCDVLFLLSFWSLIPETVLDKNVHNVVVHESNLPKGKGWSPLSWQVIEGCSKIPIVLFEAINKVDAGDIYVKDVVLLDGGELIDEIREKQARATYQLCESFISRYPSIVADAMAQFGEETFYPRRGAIDSELSIDSTIRQQFDLLRTVDNEAYPAFFYHKGNKYILKIEKDIL
jgi:hypothetical protein